MSSGEDRKNIYKWVPATYCWGGGPGDGLVSYPEGSSNTLRNAEDTGISSGYLDLWLMCAFFLHHTCKQLTTKVQRHPVQKRYSVQDTAYPIYKTQDPVNLYTLFGSFFRLIQGVPPRCKECIMSYYYCGHQLCPCQFIAL